MTIKPEDLILLIELAPKLEPPVHYKVLHRLANREGIDFPGVKRQVGRHKFYDETELREWYTLWRRANKNMGRSVGDGKRKEREAG